MDEKFTQDEASLVRRAKDGDKEAFGQLMGFHAARAYRIAFAIMQNQSDAEDVVQEAFITAYKSIGKLEKEESFRSWLGRIITSRSYDLLRKRQKQHKAIEAATSRFKTEISHAAPSPVQDKHDFDLDLREAITKLPELHRLAIMLRYSEDATAEEIAKTLNRPAGTIRRILSESYHLLRLYLQGDDKT